MSSTPWYAWYPADYKGKTNRLTYVQDSAYRRLLDEYYLIAEALPVALPELYRICNAQTDEERAAVEYVSARFFVEQSGRLHNKRADKELQKLAQHRASLSARGHAGAKARWQSTDGQSNATANATGNACAMATDMAYPQPQPYRALQPQEPNILQRERGKRDAREKPKNNVDLPDWLPLDHWQTFLAMRNRIRKPATARAQRILIGKLAVLRDQGHNPAQLLAESELKCWSSVYPPKE